MILTYEKTSLDCAVPIAILPVLRPPADIVDQKRVGKNLKTVLCMFSQPCLNSALADSHPIQMNASHAQMNDIHSNSSPPSLFSLRTWYIRAERQESHLPQAPNVDFNILFTFYYFDGFVPATQFLLSVFFV